MRRQDRVLEGRVPNNNNGDAAAALALGLIGGALIGGAIAGGGRHHGGGFRGGHGFGHGCESGRPVPLKEPFEALIVVDMNGCVIDIYLSCA